MPEDQTNSDSNEQANSTPQPDVQPAVEIEPATQSTIPDAVVAETPSQSIGSSTSKSNKKKWIIGGVSIGVLLLLALGGILFYYLWYQNSDKVITDAITNLITRDNQGTGSARLTIANKDVKLDLTVDSRANKDLSAANLKLNLQMKGATPITVDTSANLVMDKQTAYFKVNNLKATVDKVIDAYIDTYSSSDYSLSQTELDTRKQEFKRQLAPVIAKIDNRWLKTSLEEENLNSSQICLSNALSKVQSDQTMKNEIKSVYEKNRFIVSKQSLGSKDGSMGYVIDIDQKKGKDFVKGLEDTALGKELKKCSPNAFEESTTDEVNTSDLNNTRIELWVDSWSHNLTGIVMSSKVDSDDSDPTTIDVDVRLKYGKVDDISIPKDATDIEDITKEILELTNTNNATSSVSI